MNETYLYRLLGLGDDAMLCVRLIEQSRVHAHKRFARIRREYICWLFFYGVYLFRSVWRVSCWFVFFYNLRIEISIDRKRFYIYVALNYVCGLCVCVQSWPHDDDCKATRRLLEWVIVLMNLSLRAASEFGDCVARNVVVLQQAYICCCMSSLVSVYVCICYRRKVFYLFLRTRTLSIKPSRTMRVSSNAP